jgi:hypothetical protein
MGPVPPARSTWMWMVSWGTHRAGPGINCVTAMNQHLALFRTRLTIRLK